MILSSHRSDPRPRDLRHLVRTGTLNEEAADVLAMSLGRGGHILVGGNTGSGKSTLAALLLSSVDHHSHVVSVQSVGGADELVIPRRPIVRSRELEHIGVEEVAAALWDDDVPGHPPVLALDEVRSDEHARIALENAGHGQVLVLHAGSASGALARLSHIIEDPYSDQLVVDHVDLVAICTSTGVREARRRHIEVGRVLGVRGGRFELEPAGPAGD